MLSVVRRILFAVGLEVRCQTACGIIALAADLVFYIYLRSYFFTAVLFSVYFSYSLDLVVVYRL